MDEAPGKYGLCRDYEFNKFKHAVDFFNDVVPIVKSENVSRPVSSSVANIYTNVFGGVSKHHPIIIVNFRKVAIRTYTHCGVRIGKGPAGETHTPDQGVSYFDIRLAMLLEELWESYVQKGFHKEDVKP